jgi:hypothetical protein
MKEPKFESQEQITSRINLRFHRHAEKQPWDEWAEANPDLADLVQDLTEKGIDQAGAKPGPKIPEQAVAFSSPRIRAIQTAEVIMHGHKDKTQDPVRSEDDYEALVKEISTAKTGKAAKIGIDRRLDFVLDFVNGKPYAEELLKGIMSDEPLDFIVNKSDKLALEAKDTYSFTFSRGAANMASILLKYVHASKRWDDLVQDESKHYAETLERIYTTHQLVQESFIIKYLQEVGRDKEAKEFQKAVYNEGFEETEGIEIELRTSNGNLPKIHLSYKREQDNQVIFELDEDLVLDVVININNDA